MALAFRLTPRNDVCATELIMNVGLTRLELRGHLKALYGAANVALSDGEVASLAAELFGFGVLQPLLDDPLITERTPDHKQAHSEL